MIHVVPSLSESMVAGLLINELDPAVVKQRFGAKLVVISDLLKTLTKDSRIDPDEALWLVKEIARALLQALKSCVGSDLYA